MVQLWGQFTLHCKQNVRDTWIFIDQPFQGLGLGKFFQEGEYSMLSDIPARDGNIAKLLYSEVRRYFSGK